MNTETFTNKIFKKISFLDMEKEMKGEVAQKIQKESQADRLYWIEIILSSLIATFGLLQNSVAVIIGAMLIAPLLRPIQGMGFSLATGQGKYFFRSFSLLVGSIFLSVGLAFIFSLVLPIKYESEEILARTAPNILDFFIAIASAVIALLSLSYNRLSESVAGVAMAASLMPPLAVIGIELSFGNLSLAWGSFMLFFVNIIGILVVASLMFLFYGFTPHQAEFQKRMLQKVLAIFGIAVLLSFPLSQTLVNISDRIKAQEESVEIISELLEANNAKSGVSRVNIVTLDRDSVEITAVLRLPENEPFYQEFLEKMEKALAQALEKDIELDIEIIRTANIISKKEIEEKEELLSFSKEN